VERSAEMTLLVAVKGAAREAIPPAGERLAAEAAQPAIAAPELSWYNGVGAVRGPRKNRRPGRR